jgi:hypothetical protein
MSKTQKKPLSDQTDEKYIKVISLNRSEGAYGYTVHEISEKALYANSEVVEKCQPDVYAIFVNNIISLTRSLFGF